MKETGTNTDRNIVSKTNRVNRVSRVSVVVAIATLTCVALIALASPAFAHHPLGGRAPISWLEGLLSGLAHPVIGLDHLAFIVAIGLLAATQRWSKAMPICFVGAALIGTGLHLLSWNLPLPEIFISGSVLMVGWMLVQQSPLPTLLGLGLMAIAGTFHGYAYGEAIIGAQMSALVAYLIGFTAIQTGIALAAYQVAQMVWQPNDLSSHIKLRHAGFLICGLGIALLSSAIVE
jgi:urease accessory protein